MGTSGAGGKKLGVIGTAIAAIGMMVARGADDCGRLGFKGLGAAGHAAPAAVGAGDALLGAGKAAALGDDALLGAGKAAVSDDALLGAGKAAVSDDALLGAGKAPLGDPARAAAHAGDGAHAPKVLEVQPGSATEDMTGKLAEQGLDLGVEMLPGATDEQEADATEPAPAAAAAPGVKGARRAPMPSGAGSADAGADATAAPAHRTAERRPPAR